MGLINRWTVGGIVALSSTSLLDEPIEIDRPVTFTSMSSNFSWADIQPTPELQYVDCGGGYQCARLELPLDWNATISSPLYDEKFAMAIVRLPAQVPVTDPRYGGPIILNPGGPGGSGVISALSYGAGLQTVYDAAYSYDSNTYVSNHSDADYFDIIGFDPRGVGKSTPWHTCFQNSTQLSAFETQGENLRLSFPDGNLDFLWQRGIAKGQNCIWDPETNPNGSKIARFASTAMVARDLVEFAERHGQWRENSASKTDAATQRRLRWDEGNEQLQVSMISYGTVLGATLAAMQPHRVKRFVLDGVVSAEDYYNGNFTSNSLSADDLINTFFLYCAAAGSDGCALWAGNSPSDTRDRLQAIVDDITVNGPIPVPTTSYHAADVITLSDVQTKLMLLGHDVTSWPGVAQLLAPLTYRNGSAIATRRQMGHVCAGDPVNFDPYDPTMDVDSVEDTAIMIIGGDTSLHMTSQEFIGSVWAALRNTTHWTADGLASQYQDFYTWPEISGWRFGDQHAVASNVTANPILFASMLVDGVTSLASAEQMSSRFNGSGLLIVDGEGHSTLAEPSLCAGKAIRSYYQTGKLPDISRHCLPALRPFRYGNVEDVSNLSMEDKVLALALAAVALVELDLS